MAFLVAILYRLSSPNARKPVADELPWTRLRFFSQMHVWLDLFPGGMPGDVKIAAALQTDPAFAVGEK
jgi:hypothetical protein